MVPILQGPVARELNQSPGVGGLGGREEKRAPYQGSGGGQKAAAVKVIVVVVVVVRDVAIAIVAAIVQTTPAGRQESQRTCHTDWPRQQRPRGGRWKGVT